MKTSTTVVLLLLVAMAGLVIMGLEKGIYEFLRFGPPGGAEPAEQALFEPPIPDVAGLAITRPAGQNIQFVRQGDKWQLAAPARGPAKPYMVDGTIRAVSDLKVLQSYAPGAADRPAADRLGLDKPEAIVTLTEPNGKKHTVKVGAVRPLAKETYVQIDGNDTVYLVRGTPTPSLTRPVGEYRENSVLDFDAKQVVRADVVGPQQYQLTREDNAWRVTAPLQAAADKVKVESWIGRVKNLSAVSFVNTEVTDLSAYGLDKPRLTITVALADPSAATAPTTTTSTTASAPASMPVGKTFTVAFGARAGGKTFARLDGESWLFQVRDEDADALAGPLEDMRDRAIVRVNPAEVIGVQASQGDKTLTLAKDKGQWLIKAPAEGAPQAPAVEGLLNALKDLKADDFVDRYASLAGFGLEKPTARYELTLTDGTKRTLLVGSASTSGQMVFVKLANEPTVMAVTRDSLKALSADPADYWSRDILAAPRGEIADITVTAPQTSYRIEQPTLGQFTLVRPAQGQVDRENLDALLLQVGNLQADKVAFVGDAVPADYAQGTPIRLAVTTGPRRPLPEHRPTSSPATATASAPSSAPTTTQATTLPAATTITLVINKKGADVFVWIQGAKPVVVARASESLYNAVLAEMRSRSPWTVGPQDVQAFTLASGGKAIPLVNTDGTWRFSGDEFLKIDATKVQEFLSFVQGVKAERIVSDNQGDLARWGLDKPQTTLSIRSAAGTLTLAVSATGPDGQAGRYAMVTQTTTTTSPASASPAPGVFVLPADMVGKLGRDVESFTAKASPAPKAPAGMPGMPEMPPSDGMPEEE